MAGFTLSSARLSVTTGSLPVLSFAPSIAPYTIRSASELLPFRSTLLTSAVTSGEPYTGSVTSCRLVAGPLRGMSAPLLLRSVAAARLLAVAHPLRVEGAADDLVADAGQVAHPATSHQHDRVLLKVVPDARDVGRDLDLAGEPDPGDLAERGVRLLGRGRVDARADPAALGAALERRGRCLGYLVLAALADQLLDGGHRVSVFKSSAGAVRHVVDEPDLLVFRPLRPPWSGVSLSPRRTGPGKGRTFEEGSPTHAGRSPIPAILARNRSP